MLHFNVEPATSISGTALTNVSSVIGNNAIKKVIWTGTKWIAIAAAGKVCNSSSIGTWTSRTTGASGNLIDINYNAGVAMAISDTGEIIRSTDNGDTWTLLTSPTNNPFGGSALKFIKYRLNNWWTGGAGGKLGQSSDGQTFILVTSGFGVDTINDFEAV